jgi:hypothetical protein
MPPLVGFKPVLICRLSTIPFRPLRLRCSFISLLLIISRCVTGAYLLTYTSVV